jgi:hypothetical protein
MSLWYYFDPGKEDTHICCDWLMPEIGSSFSGCCMNLCNYLPKSPKQKQKTGFALV